MVESTEAASVGGLAHARSRELTSPPDANVKVLQ